MSGHRATGGRRFKPRALELTDGGRLVLGVDGSIDHIDDDGSRAHRWTPDDPEWPDLAIRSTDRAAGTSLPPDMILTATRMRR